MYRYISASISDIGTVRQVNEDGYLDNAAQGLWLVADGMGGHFAGDYASAAIVNAFAASSFDSDSMADSLNHIDNILMQVNAHLIDYAFTHEYRVVGSTFVLLLVRENIGVCLWMGDSRLYRVRQGEIVCMTKDHSYVQELMERGELSLEDSTHHPSKHIITRAIGSDLRIRYDLCVFDPEKDDRYLLCSDGLYNMVTDERMAQVLKSSDDMPFVVNTLLADALSDGADDNVTIIGIVVREQ